MTTFSIIREPDDQAAEARVSIGKAPEDMGYYLVFRGDPAVVLDTLHVVTAEAERALPAGEYADKRGRPQG